MRSIYFKESGEGPTLILLHGFCETHQIWEEITPKLSIHFKVILIDLPGFGKSPLLKSPFTLNEVGQAITQLIIEIGIQKCVLVGHSLGGYVALAMAAENPDLFKGICLFHSTALADNDEKKANRNKTMSFVQKNGAFPFIKTFVPALFSESHPKNIERVFKIASKTSKKSILEYSCVMRDRPDMSPLLKVFLHPILFLAGNKDNIIPVATLDEQVKASKCGKLEILTETGHMGMFEEPEKSFQILKDFAKACFHPALL